jgi:hypothetical protein
VHDAGAAAQPTCNTLAVAASVPMSM